MGKINKILALQEENKRLKVKVRYYKKKCKEEKVNDKRDAIHNREAQKKDKSD